MFRKSLLLVLFVACVSNTFSQNSMNDYKYVIVPIEYKFQKTENSFDINELVKFLFNKEGFNVYLNTDDLPDDLRLNDCLALTADLINDSNMLTTKMYFEMKDCHDKVVYKTEVAKSKEKDYRQAYHKAIRGAFEYIKAENYEYNGSVSEVVVEENNNSTKKVAATTVTVSSTNPSQVAETPVKNDVVEVEPSQTVETNTSSAKVAVAASSVPVLVDSPVKKTVDEGVLYAQEIENGYQLVDSTPKVVYIALATSVKDVYLIKGVDGVIYKTEDGWVAEEYIDGKITRKLLSIKLL